MLGRRPIKAAAPVRKRIGYGFPIALLFVGLAPANSVGAQNTSAFCQSLWATRSLLLDRYGQCHETPLGAALFDNENCSGTPTQFYPIDQMILSRLTALEAGAACAIDTDSTALHTRAAETLSRMRELATLPLRAETEHGCTGYLGPALSIHAGISQQMTQTGTLEPGMNVSLSHDPMPGGWEYITVTDNDGLVAHGWVQGLVIDATTCAQPAG